MPNALITGASRGIGLALCREYLQRGWYVRATCRNPAKASQLLALKTDGQLSIEELDVNDELAVIDCAEATESPVDLLINNAGINMENVSLDDLDLASFAAVLETNLVAPLAVTRSFQQPLRRSDNAKVVVISSAMGSIATTKATSNLAYRCSKAAVNLAFKAIAEEWKAQNIAVGILTPGVVATDMTAQMTGDLRMISAEQSAAGLAKLIDGLSLETSGRFFRYNGEEVAW